MNSMMSGRIIASLALALMMLLPGCLEEVTSSEQEFDWNRDYVPVSYTHLTLPTSQLV
mgnify:CR=1 FL=1